jgi:hypothetical protein
MRRQEMRRQEMRRLSCLLVSCFWSPPRPDLRDEDDS